LNDKCCQEERMKFSDRVLRVKPSQTLVITAKAAEMKKKGIDVIGFG